MYSISILLFSALLQSYEILFGIAGVPLRILRCCLRVGCTATFAGVYMIAWSGPANASPDQDGEQTDLDAAGRSTPGELSRLVTGSLGRGTQVRRKHSSTSLVGFSPAQV